MRLITMMLLMTFFVSCNSFQILCDTSFVNSRCRCRCISTKTLKETDKINCKKDWDKYFFGTPEDHPIDYNIHMCEGISGFRIEEVAKDIIPDIKKERAFCEDKGL